MSELAQLTLGAASDAAAPGDGHLYLGLGLIATALVVIWLIRRSRA